MRNSNQKKKEKSTRFFWRALVFARRASCAHERECVQSSFANHPLIWLRCVQHLPVQIEPEAQAAQAAQAVALCRHHNHDLCSPPDFCSPPTKTKISKGRGRGPRFSGECPSSKADFFSSFGERKILKKNLLLTLTKRRNTSVSPKKKEENEKNKHNRCARYERAFIFSPFRALVQPGNGVCVRLSTVAVSRLRH